MKEQILELLNETSKTIKRNIIANSSYKIYDIIDIKTSAVEKDNVCIKCSYEPQDDIKDLLFKIGEIINNELLVEMFGKPATIEEIIEYNRKNSLQYCVLSDIFKELEQVSKNTNKDDDEYRYKYSIYGEVVEKEIYKHIPSGKFYRFYNHFRANGDFFHREFDGEVVEKQITKTIWEVVK